MTDITVRAGLPFNQSIRIQGATAIWPDLAQVELQAQIRAGLDAREYSLLLDLTPFITLSVDGADLVAAWSMTGADTRTVPGGQYEMLLSDLGSEDARAVSILEGRITVDPIGVA